MPEELKPPGHLTDKVRRFFHNLGPGVVTGAADDDPSGISTYSVTGAQFGFSQLWTVLFTFPLMAAVQSMCARLGLVRGEGLASTIRRFFPRWVLIFACLLLIVANVINIGADLAGIAESLEMVTHVSRYFWMPVAAVGIVCALIWWSYHRLANTFKWLTLVLFVYVVAAILAKPDWGLVLRSTFLPSIEWNTGYLMTLVGVLGTTITPYMFFWQSAQEVEEEREHGKKTLRARMGATKDELKIAQTDVLTGMGWAGIAMYFIILTSASTLHRPGMKPIETAQQAAEALRPLAGDAAYLLFTLGIVGTGILAVPVLAGSAAYAVAEAFHWEGSLNDRPKVAQKFYGVIALAVLVGLGLNLLGISAVKALFYSAIANGVLAPPLVVLVTLLTSRKDVMGDHVSPPWMRTLGWVTAVAMSAAAIAMFVSR